MKRIVPFLATLFIALSTVGQSGPELVFTNPVLVSGTANKEGAIYRFSNVATGVDATVKLKKFSRNDITMATVDNAVLGWNKAFQPEFGLAGLVAANQNWYVDFEMIFYKAGTNNKQKMDTVDLTALDVDGDGSAISEYVTYDKPNSVLYSTVSYLTNAAVGALGQSFVCAQDNLLSTIIICLYCGGDGILSGDDCSHCDGTGIVHSLCGHAYEGGSGNTVLGPVSNFVNIDTAATQVMATYQYLKTDRIRFRYGAKTNNNTSNGAGIRLNSTWFREFSLTPQLTTLPIKLSSFTAMLTNNKAELKWITSYEKDVNYFAIEKSADGKDFSQIGVVFAKGNSTENNSYAYPDAAINTTKEGIVYYRLRSVDVDGKSQVSDVKLIRISKQNEQVASIVSYPNPVVNELRVTIPTNWQGKKVSYEVLNNSGQPAYRKEAGSSSQTETIGVAQLSPGFYIVKVSCNGEVAQQKIIKK
jgi:hypothetical protein